jgi:hypothetical protein
MRNRLHWKLNHTTHGRALRQRAKGSIMTATIKPDRHRFQTDVRGGLERLEKDGNAED